MSRLWERQVNESSKAYQAFSLFRDLGAERESKIVAEKLSKSVSLIGRWRLNHSWDERARAWDNELTRAAKVTAVREVRDMVERHIRASTFLQGKSLNALNNLRTESLTPRDAIAMYKLGVDVERLSRGEPTEQIAEVQETTQKRDPLDDLTPDEIRQLIAIGEAQNAASES